MKRTGEADTTRIPLAEEELTVDKKLVETGKVRLSNRVEEEQARIRETLAQERVRVERLATDHMLDQPPELREEPDRLVVPVFEEVLVKRYRVTEEVHLIRERSTEAYDETVTLRSNKVEVERS
jgi:stress response protein YsnF